MHPAPPSSRSPSERLAPPLLPWAWFAVAHLALLTAVAIIARDPALFGGFYYHPRAVAVVHLVTLGWISCNIVGSLYLVAPIALRRPLPTGRLDGLALALSAIGISGMVAHFWLDSYAGMAWAAGTVILGLLIVARTAAPLYRGDKVPAPVRWHVALAFTNLVTAGVLGLLIGIEKIGGLTLPGPPLGAVQAHAHLAALGWGLMMLMGIGYRLLPMQLPAAIPPGSGPVGTALLLEAGLAAVAVGAMGARPELLLAGAGAVVAAVLWFLYIVAGMLRQRRRSPRGAPRLDPALVTAGLGLLYLPIAAGLGLVLAAMPASELSIRLIFVYGTCGLLGFLSQVIVGVGGRLLPLNAWLQLFVRSGYRPPARGVFEVPSLTLQWLVLGCWAIAVPALAAGLATGEPTPVRSAALLLGVAVVADGWNRWRALRAARPARRYNQSEPSD